MNKPLIYLHKPWVNNKLIQKTTYKHYKGNLYKVLDLGIHTETEETMVIYKALNDVENKIWIRPASIWNESVEYNGTIVQRFTVYVE